MTLRRALLRALDRPGGRGFLGALLTCLARKHVPGVHVGFRRGMWMHWTANCTFVDFPALDYHPSMFRAWKNEAPRLESNAGEHWFHLYQAHPGDVIVDIGAGKGEDTLAFSRAVGPAGRVIAIEAHPVTFRCLRLFCELNDLRNVTPMNYAIVDKCGPVTIETTKSWQTNSIAATPGPLTVPGLTLDELIQRENIQNINFLKMNIEGAEALAVKGMAAAFRRIQMLCICCHDFRANAGDGEIFRTRRLVQTAVENAGLRVVSRDMDPRPYIADQVNATRSLRS